MTVVRTQNSQPGSDITETDVQNYLRSRPTTVRRIAKFLVNRYGSLIDLRNLESRPLDECIDHLLTRALAAHAVASFSGMDPSDSARCVVDGGQDLGIDAIAFDESQKRCWLIQSKFVQGGQGRTSWTIISKFLQGFECIVSDSYEHANSKILAMREDITLAISEVAWRFTLVLATTSHNPVENHDLNRIHEKLEYQDPGNMGTFTFDNFDLNRVTRSVEESLAPSSIDLDIQLSEWGCVTEPFRAFYGHVQLSTIIEWRQHGVSLFDKNLRGFDPSSHVAASIEKTLSGESGLFWYLNNGATLLCESIERRGPYSGTQSRATGHFHCKGVSVVNGAQTIGTIWEKVGDGENLDPNAKVHIRLISLENASEEFGAKVTKATNTQKNILARDFATLDAAQKKLQNQFALDGLIYVFRTGISPPKPDEGCTLEEVSIALACERSIETSVIAHRNPGYLTDPDNSYYKSIFHGKNELRSEEVWRSVRIYRLCVLALSQERNTSSGRPQQVATHGARYIIYRVFNDPKIKSIRGEWSKDTATAIKDATLTHLGQITAYLENATGYLQVLFKNTDRVKGLDESLAGAGGSSSSERVKRQEIGRQQELFKNLPPEGES